MNTLILEVTRRCTCTCEHCLRGNAQNKQMDSYFARRILDNVEPASVHLSGGEPLLNIEVLKEVMYHRSVGSVSVITSGNLPKGKTKAFAEIWGNPPRHMELYLSRSKDYYHPKNSRVYDFENELEMWGIDVGTHDVSHKLLPMGRATEFGDRELQETLDEEEGSWYVTVDGDVYPVCDLSYAMMRRFKSQLCFGNAVTDSMEVLNENWKRMFEGKKVTLSEHNIRITNRDE